MGETFYHVDRQESLEIGSTLQLECPGRLVGNWYNSPRSDEHMECLEELYPEGLSRHGARYAHPRFLNEELDFLNEGWMATTGSVEVHNPNLGETDSKEIVPYIVHYEQQFELLRMLEFQDKRSRFQSFFGFQTVQEAIEFHEKHRSEVEERIVEVECSDFEIRDMDLVSANYFGEIFSRGRKYWQGEAVSDSPTWEVVMEPPIEVVDIVEEVN